MATPTRYERLPTERAHAQSRALDRMTPLAVARLMHREDRRAVAAVGRVLPQVARAVDAIVGALGAGGRLFFVGAGTSGRLGVLEAAECPPTFGTPRTRVQAIMAGGRQSVFRSREGAEDDRAAAAREVRRRVRAGDVVVGVSASGVTPFVRAALGEAARRGAVTVLVSCNPTADGALAAAGPVPGGTRGQAAATGRAAAHASGPAAIVIAAAPGPEILAGSTRLKAGTATKLVLNMLTTASMARLGRVHGNRMVDVQPRSRKLRERAVRLIHELAGVPEPAARRALGAAGGRVRLAVDMARTGGPAARAARALRTAGGSLRAVLDGTRPRGRRA
jgi:N-acetylmuramic acid 6-phosphate etherase